MRLEVPAAHALEDRLFASTPAISLAVEAGASSCCTPALFVVTVLRWWCFAAADTGRRVDVEALAEGGRGDDRGLCGRLPPPPP